MTEQEYIQQHWLPNFLQRVTIANFKIDLLRILTEINKTKSTGKLIYLASLLLQKAIEVRQYKLTIAYKNKT